LLFNLYKYEDKKGKRLYGFSYLPLASEGDTILPDKIYKGAGADHLNRAGFLINAHIRATDGDV
jgi:hypothetical protein